MPEGEGGNQPGAGGANDQGGQGGGSGNQPGAGGGQGGQAPQGGADLARFERELKEAREEAAKYRTTLRDAENKLKEHERAKMSDEEKRAAEIADLRKQLEARDAEQAKLNAKIRESEVERAAARAGAKKPHQIARLIDTDAKDLDKEIAAFKKENPELFAGGTPGSADGGRGTGNAPQHNVNDVLRNMVRRGRG